MKHNAIVGNIGHFDNEIEMAALEASRRRADQHQAAGRRVALPRRPLDHRPLRRPAAQPRQRHRAPELRDVELLHQPGDRPDRALRPAPRSYEAKQVYVLPKHLDEKVARLHLAALGVEADRAERRPGRLPRHPGRGPLQARPLPLLARAAAVGTCRTARHRASRPGRRAEDEIQAGGRCEYVARDQRLDQHDLAGEPAARPFDDRRSRKSPEVPTATLLGNRAGVRSGWKRWAEADEELWRTMYGRTSGAEPMPGQVADDDRAGKADVVPSPAAGRSRPRRPGYPAKEGAGVADAAPELWAAGQRPESPGRPRRVPGRSGSSLVKRGPPRGR